jgi:hypothetical protein
MDRKFLKREKLDDLHIPTLLKIIQLTNDRASIIKAHAMFFKGTGDYSPSKISAREDELKQHANFLEKIADILKAQGE